MSDPILLTPPPTGMLSTSSPNTELERGREGGSEGVSGVREGGREGGRVGG